MTMATTNDYIKCQQDSDLSRRFIAMAKMLGIEGADNWVTANYPKLLGFKVDGVQTVVDVYAYADTQREQAIAAVPPVPGSNMAAVTDDNLRAAVQEFMPSSEPTTE